MGDRYQFSFKIFRWFHISKTRTLTYNAQHDLLPIPLPLLQPFAFISTISPYMILLHSTLLHSAPLHSTTMVSLKFFAHQAQSFILKGFYSASSHICNFFPMYLFSLLPSFRSQFEHLSNQEAFLTSICKEYFLQPHLSPLPYSYSLNTFNDLIYIYSFYCDSPTGV